MHLQIFSLATVLALAGSAAANGFSGTLNVVSDTLNGDFELAVLEVAFDGSDVKFRGTFPGYDKCSDGDSPCSILFVQTDGGGTLTFHALVSAPNPDCQHIDFQNFLQFGAGQCCGNPCHLEA